jgi:hypothetical protein
MILGEADRRRRGERGRGNRGKDIGREIEEKRQSGRPRSGQRKR